MNWKIQQGLELLWIRDMIPHLSSEKIAAEDKESSERVRSTELG